MKDEKQADEKLMDLLWNVKEGKTHPNRAWKSILQVFKSTKQDKVRGVGQSEQLKAEVFKLANKLAVAGEGDAAVAMHGIHNRL